MTSNLPDLPREVAIAWGQDGRSRRGSRPGLSLDRITHAAIELADAHGLGAISMARVANELGFTTMSLYRYVDSKDQLLALMVDAANGPAPKDRHQGGDWRSGLATWTRELLKVFSAHSWIVEVPITGPPMLPNALDWMDWALSIMEATPLTPAERMSTLLLLSGYARTEAQLAADLARGQAAPDRRPEDEDQRYSQLLIALVPPDRMPALHALATTGLFASTLTPEVDDDVYFFEFGLDRILDGLEHYANRRRDEA